MIAFRVFGRYLAWHYTLALTDFVRLGGNFLWFFYHFFSIPIIIRTLFAPWHRLGERYGHKLDPGAVLGTFIVNTLMRLVGFVIRIIFLAVGLLTLILTAILGTTLFVFWLALPFVILALIWFSIFLIFFT